MNLQFFCETCQEITCDMCLKAGPHNSHFHKIVTINEAYGYKFAEMKNIVGICN